MNGTVPVLDVGKHSCVYRNVNVEKMQAKIYWSASGMVVTIFDSEGFTMGQRGCLWRAVFAVEDYFWASQIFVYSKNQFFENLDLIIHE